MLALPRGGATRRAIEFHLGWERGAENSDVVSVWRTPHIRYSVASPLLGRGTAIRYVLSRLPVAPLRAVLLALL